MRRAKWKSRGVDNLDKAEELYETRTKCEICGGVKRLHLDHCHANKLARGILCSRCNLALGLMSDNSKLLRKAAEYIDNSSNVVYN